MRLAAVLVVTGLSILALSSPACAKEKPSPLDVPLIGCQPAEQPPAIDGKLDDPCWRSAQRIFDFHDCEKETVPEGRTEVFLLHDSQFLYVAYKCHEPHTDKIRARCEEDGLALWRDDCVETYFDKDLDDVLDDRFCINAIGAHSWKERSEDWEVGCAVAQDHWVCETKVPFVDLSTHAPGKFQVWKINFCRERKPKKEYTAWTGVGTFKDVKNFGKVVFVPRPVPRIGRLDLSALGFEQASIPLTVVNPTSREQELRIILKTASLTGDVTEGATSVTVPPGKEVESTVSATIEKPGQYRYQVTLADAKTGAVYQRHRSHLFAVVPLRAQVATLEGKVRGILADLDQIETHFDQSRKLRTEVGQAGDEIAQLKKAVLDDTTLTIQEWREHRERLTHLAARFEQLDRDAIKVRAYAFFQRREQQPAYGFGVCSSLRKLWFHEPFPGTITDEIALSAARNERESFQLVILPFWQDLRGIQIEASDLTGGHRIDKSNVTWHPVGYVRVTPGPYKVWKDRKYWPDPLLNDRAFDVATDAIQPVWVTVYVPPDTPPGDYVGSLTVRPSGAHTLPAKIRLRVRSFTLPARNHLRNEYNFSPTALARQFRLRKQAMWDRSFVECYKRYLTYLLDHGGGSPALGTGFGSSRESRPFQWPVRQNRDGSYDLSRLDELLGFAVERGQNNFWVTMACKVLIEKRSAAYLDAWKKFLTSYAEHLRDRGWLRYGYFYNYDEPQCGGAPPEGFETVKAYSKMVRELVPDLQIMCTSGAPNPEKKGPRNLYGAADVWLHSYSTLSEERRRNGEQVIWYGFGARPPALTFKIEFPAVTHRLRYWLCWKYQVKGYGWDWINKWRLLKPYDKTHDEFAAGVHEDEPSASRESIAKPSSTWPRIPWEIRDNDMCMFYPGQTAEDGPVGSIRMELIRDGIEDHEYFALLREKLEGLKKTQPDHRVVEPAAKLLAVPEDIAASIREYTLDASLLLRYREELAEALEEMDGEPGQPSP